MARDDDKRDEITNVTIFGLEYPLHSEESTDYTRRVAAFVDQKMAEIASQKNLADPTKVAIMAAMDIADQLLKRRKKLSANDKQTAEALGRLEQLLNLEDQG